MKVNIEPSWAEALQSEFDKEYFVRLTHFVHNEYSHYRCYPPAQEVFNAFNLCPLKDVKVVILGQDPYHGPGQAEGLCFSVKTGIPLPPSLINIFKEIKNDIGTVPPIIEKPVQQSLFPLDPGSSPVGGGGGGGSRMYDGSLRRWAEQGVLLLNATLTVREHLAGSHQKQGWETFTDAVIKTISDTQEHVVFILWGGYARTKAKLIDKNKHCILESVHPSPLSANRGGWFGNRHFSRCNEYLKANNREEIKW